MNQKPAPGAKKGRAAPNPFQFQANVSDPSAPEPAAPTAPRPSRPNLVDYLVLLLGFALSVCLARIGPMPVEARDFVADVRLRTAVSYLPDLMRLPEGVILLGPLFLGMQFLTGRRQGLTTIGWLWVFSWMGVAVCTGLLGWKNGSPETAPAWIARGPWLWYLILVPSMAALGVVLGLVGLFSRRPAPWTHTFGLALLLWPVPALAAVLAVAKF